MPANRWINTLIIFIWGIAFSNEKEWTNDNTQCEWFWKALFWPKEVRHKIVHLISLERRNLIYSDQVSQVIDGLKEGQKLTKMKLEGTF